MLEYEVRRLAATGGCRAVGTTDAPSGGGPNRATVVVDTGSGPVWSACISFSGTISGVGRVLKERLGREVLVVAVEPASSPVLSGGEPGPNKIQGIGAGFVPRNYDPSVVDRVVAVGYEESLETARRLCREEGIFCGISSGAITWAAREVARELGEGRRVLSIICDFGERYLSHELFAAV